MQYDFPRTPWQRKRGQHFDLLPPFVLIFFANGRQHVLFARGCGGITKIVNDMYLTDSLTFHLSKQAIYTKVFVVFLKFGPFHLATSESQMFVFDIPKIKNGPNQNCYCLQQIIKRIYRSSIPSTDNEQIICFLTSRRNDGRSNVFLYKRWNLKTAKISSENLKGTGPK